MEVGNEFTITEIRRTTSSTDVEEARTLFREYQEWLQIDLCFQNFAAELSGLPGDYTAPDGCLLLASHNAHLAGCIALRKLDSQTCEMKRLFVREAFRGKRIGRSLIEMIIREAIEIGYERMRLDTIPPQMNDAISMYRSFGFKDIPPYTHNPVHGAKFMELDLRKVSEARP